MNVVVTGGGTRAPIDDVRSIVNASTGRFSAEITEAFLRRGAAVWHLHAPGAVLPFEDRTRFRLEARDFREETARIGAAREEWLGARDRYHPLRIGVGTVAEYAQALEEALTARTIDMAVLAMAVSDYEPEPSSGKIPSDRGPWPLTLVPTPKVIQAVRRWAPGVFLVGFKLLHGATVEELVGAARRACVLNDADLTVANDLHAKRRGKHAVHVVDRDRALETIGPGGPIAERLVERLLREYEVRRSGGRP